MTEQNPREQAIRQFHPLATTDKNVTIPYDLLDPHYSDRRFFDKTHTIFLDTRFETIVTRYGVQIVEGAHYVYSDRLWENYGTERCLEAFHQADAVVGNKESARYLEEYLRKLYNQPDLELIHIVAGVNRSDGYSFRVFGYIDPTEPKPEVSKE